MTNDAINLSLESSQARTYTRDITCYSGHELRGEVVADLALEARQGSSGAFTNIETTPIDLTPYAGTTVPFEIRITAGTITTHGEVRAFKVEVGPA